MKRIIAFLLKRKIALIIAAVVLAGGGYWAKARFFQTEEAVRYVFGEVQKGTLIDSISGTGQISVSNQVEVKAKASGEITAVYVKNGQEVKSGTLLVQIDASDGYKTVRDAETNLETAKLSLEKISQPADDYSIMQAQNAITSAKNNLEKLKFSQESDYQTALETKRKAKDNITKAYEDAYNEIASAFLDLPTVISGLNDILYGKDISAVELSVGSNQENGSALLKATDKEEINEMRGYLASAQNDYKTAREKYDQNFKDYKEISRYSDNDKIEALLDETAETVKAIAQSAKSESNFLDAWADSRSKYSQPVFTSVKTYQNNLSGYISKTNSHLSSLLSLQKTLTDNEDSLASAERKLKEMKINNPIEIADAETSIKEKEASLEKLKAGPDALDVRSQQLVIKQKENVLIEAKEALADYSARAPFDGVVAKVNVKKGDTASSGTSVATLVAKQMIAEISLNEVDAAKVQVGQKVTLTFDAIEDLSIAGAVAEIDTLGTVSQGVVSYTVKIVFDAQDERIKSGMTVSANIIINAKTDVLMIQTAALKTNSDGSYYVEQLENGSPVKKEVKIDSNNDTMTEITEGLSEGDSVITQTITASSSGATQSSGGSSSRNGGMGGMMMLR